MGYLTLRTQRLLRIFGASGAMGAAVAPLSAEVSMGNAGSGLAHPFEETAGCAGLQHGQPALQQLSSMFRDYKKILWRPQTEASHLC